MIFFPNEIRIDFRGLGSKHLRSFGILTLLDSCQDNRGVNTGTTSLFRGGTPGGQILWEYKSIAVFFSNVY